MKVRDYRPLKENNSNKEILKLHCRHMMSFQRRCDVVQYRMTSCRRRNHVVCLRGKRNKRE